MSDTSLKHESRAALLAEVTHLRTRLEEAEESLRAIREGEVDAIVVSGTRGQQVFSLTGSDLIYRRAAETMAEGIITVSSAGTVLFSNSRFAELLGRPLNEIAGHALGDFVGEDERPSLHQLLTQARGKTIKQRLVLHNAAGLGVPVHVSATALLMAEDMHICLVATDLRELEASNEMLRQVREQQEALRESEGRLRFALEAAQMGEWDLDLETMAMTRSTRYDQVFGYDSPQAEWSWATFLAHVLPEDRASLEQRFHQAIHSGGEHDSECRIRRPDGAVRWIWLKAVFDPAEDGGASRCARGIVLDITPRKEAEQSLRQSEERARRRLTEIEAIYNSVPIGMCVLDRELRYVRVNPWLAEINGLTPAKHLGRTVREIVPSLAQPVEAIAQQVLKTRQPVLNIALSGTTRADPGLERHWVEHWLPLLDSKGEVAGIHVVVDDVTEQKRYEQRLQELNRQLSELLAERTGLAERQAHQLRELMAELTRAEQRERERVVTVLHDHVQPLLIGARMKLGMLKSGDPGPKREFIAAEVQELITQTIEATRSLSMTLNPLVLKEQGLAAALEWLAQSVALQHHLRLRTYIDSAAEPADETTRILCFQAVRELLLNVVKHAHAPRASLSMQIAQPGVLQLKVRDRGQGFSVKTGPQKPSGQQGYGVPTLRRRLAMIGGRLELESAPGKGTTATVIVPLHAGSDPGAKAMAEPETPAQRQPSPASEETTAERAAARSAARGGRVRVLLADDHRIFRQSLRHFLRQHKDLEVIGEAASGHSAVALTGRLQPDVVVLDVAMPKGNGIEAAQEIRRQWPQVEIIALSMHEEADRAKAMREAGAAVYLAKSGPVERLVQAIRQCTGRTRPSPKRLRRVNRQTTRRRPVSHRLSSGA